MKLNHKISKPPRIEMLPLIDIVFLLLVFFIYAMLSMSVHGGRQVDLPSSQLADKIPEAPIAVTLEAHQGNVLFRINGQEIDEEDFISTLQEQGDILKTEEKEPTVQLFADRTLSYQQVYQTLDQITRAGLSRVYLQARPGEQ